MQNKKKISGKKFGELASPRATRLRKKASENLQGQAKKVTDIITSSTRKQKPSKHYNVEHIFMIRCKIAPPFMLSCWLVMRTLTRISLKSEWLLKIQLTICKAAFWFVNFHKVRTDILICLCKKVEGILKCIKKWDSFGLLNLLCKLFKYGEACVASWPVLQQEKNGSGVLYFNSVWGEKEKDFRKNTFLILTLEYLSFKFLVYQELLTFIGRNCLLL